MHWELVDQSTWVEMQDVYVVMIVYFLLGLATGFALGRTRKAAPQETDR